MRSLELAERLAAIVDTQQEIASTRLDLRNVMELRVRRAQELTRANGAVMGTLLEARAARTRPRCASAQRHA
jgi:hypothetical protein